ncbi:MAG: AMP-binding protein [Oligoflexia bacterium]|nr:AMP-binding protein [Oligoflexia bacterium]
MDNGLMAMAFELDWLKRWSLYQPNKICIRCADSLREFSYQEVFERVLGITQYLQVEYKITKGDRVACLSTNEPEYLFLFFALQRLGAILVPVNFRFSKREIDFVLKNSEAKLVIYEKEFKENISHELTLDLSVLRTITPIKEESIFDAKPDDAVMILYTSGTTGFPKGAIIDHQMLFWNSISTGLRLEIQSSDRSLLFHPFFHTSGWNVLTTPFLHHGASIVFLKKFDADRVLELCDSEKISILFGVPTMMDMMAASQKFTQIKFDSVRYAIVGGEPMSVPLIEKWNKKGVPIRQGYGLTEFGPNVFSLNEEDAVRKIGSIGFPNFYIEVKIVDAEGNELLEPNTVGELCLRGPACTQGYWKNEEATQSAIQRQWLHTGDLVRKDEDGYFYVVGRKKEMIISGGENIYPAEIEAYLMKKPEMREVAIVGVSDEKWGEVGKCFYSTHNEEPIAEENLKKYCLEGLAKYKIPKTFVYIKSLPKGDSGKILKKALSNL